MQSLPLNSYQKTDLTGGDLGTDFDDFKNLSSNNEKPVKITSMVICSSANFINAIRVTYLTSKGTSTTLTHGTLVRENWLEHSNFALLDFNTNEWITRVDISYRHRYPTDRYMYFNYLKIETTNSVGSIRSYGPFGKSVSSENISTVVGVVHGLYSRATDWVVINALGFYV